MILTWFRIPTLFVLRISKWCIIWSFKCKVEQETVWKIYQYSHWQRHLEETPDFSDHCDEGQDCWNYYNLSYVIIQIPKRWCMKPLQLKLYIKLHIVFKWHLEDIHTTPEHTYMGQDETDIIHIFRSNGLKNVPYRV